MHDNYNDIRQRIIEEPRWFDENAVPRYCDFESGEQSSIYADEVVLLLIACQNCGHKFKVVMSTSDIDLAMARITNPDHPPMMLRFQIQAGTIHFGDPPNIDCCPAGPTMNCMDLKVLEYWHSPMLGGGWERDAELEIDLPDLDPKSWEDNG